MSKENEENQRAKTYENNKLKGIVSIVFEANSERSAAYVECNLIGECEFEVSGTKWIITHTGVRPNYKGQGIAKLLVECVIEEARKNQVKVLPICSYAKKMMIEKEEYKDVLLNK